MAKYRYSLTVRGNFINGAFRHPSDPNGEWVGKSPADLSDETGKFRYAYYEVDEAVRAARHAFSAWRLTALSERADLMRKYQASLKHREEELAEAISREVGKPLWEAKTEAAAMINKIDVSLNESIRFVSDLEVLKIMENTNGVCRYRPLGVMAVVGPFNFPGHLPNGHIVPALLTGNTVVFKPSEKAPMVGQIMAECFQESRFPQGVFNLIQGERETGRRLCVHEGVDGILFTGSYEVGVRIKQDTLHQHWKMLALEMGGKNPVIVWEDAKLDVAVYETLVGAFITAGQRCSATSRVIVHEKVFDRFLSEFHKRAKSFSIGHPLDNPFMGPMIEHSTVDRYMKFLGIALREGCEVVMRGKVLDTGHNGHYVTPSICCVKEPSVEGTKKSVYQQTELFAPNVALLSVNDLGEAIAQANATQYGLVAAVFTQSKSVYGKCLEELNMGLVNWNKSTVGASSRLPFGGLKKSGNHRPTAFTAMLYCTAPVSSLEVSEPAMASPMPGLNWS